MTVYCFPKRRGSVAHAHSSLSTKRRPSTAPKRILFRYAGVSKHLSIAFICSLIRTSVWIGWWLCRKNNCKDRAFFEPTCRITIREKERFSGYPGWNPLIDGLIVLLEKIVRQYRLNRYGTPILLSIHSMDWEDFHLVKFPHGCLNIYTRRICKKFCHNIDIQPAWLIAFDYIHFAFA